MAGLFRKDHVADPIASGRQTLFTMLATVLFVKICLYMMHFFLGEASLLPCHVIMFFCFFFRLSIFYCFQEPAGNDPLLRDLIICNLGSRFTEMSSRTSALHTHIFNPFKGAVRNFWRKDLSVVGFSDRSGPRDSNPQPRVRETDALTTRPNPPPPSRSVCR